MKYLNTSFTDRLAIGAETSCDFSIPDVLRQAVMHGVYGVSLAHNHPNGSLSPSVADIETTKDLYIRLQLIGIKLLDHIIMIPGGRRLSMSDSSYFDGYQSSFEIINNASRKGSFEYTVNTLVADAFKKVNPTYRLDYALTGLNKQLEKVYITLIPSCKFFCYNIWNIINKCILLFIFGYNAFQEENGKVTCF